MTQTEREISEILDKDSEMHETNCASVHSTPFPCDCKREEKVVLLADYIYMLVGDGIEALTEHYNRHEARS